MNANPQPTPSDAELVAYLDGELSPADSVRIGQQIAADPALSARLNLLMNGGRPFRDAFAPLLEQAPVEKLEAMLTALAERPPAGRLPVFARRLWPAALVAGLALMAVGAGLDRIVASSAGSSFLGMAARDDDDEDGWRIAVTQYLALYTRETLSIVPDEGEAARHQELASLGARLGLDLDESRIMLPGLSFKRAEMFSYDGQPLAFLAYLDPTAGPISLCIIAGAGADSPPRVERRNGMTVVYWARSGHGFMLIGRGDPGDLRSRADLVASRFGGATGAGKDDRG